MIWYNKMPLLDEDLEEEQLVIRKYHRIGKLIPKVEGPHYFVRYASPATVIIADIDTRRESGVHINHLWYWNKVKENDSAL